MQVEWLYRLARALHYQGPSTQDILRTSLSLTCTALEVKQACIITFDELGELKDAFLLGTNVEDEQELWHKLLTQGLIGFVQHGQRTVNIRNISSDPRWPQLAGELDRLGGRRADYLPLDPARRAGAAQSQSGFFHRRRG